MAKITDLPVASTIDATADVLAIVTNSINTTQQISRNTLLNLSSDPVGKTDTQTLINKTLTAPAISSPVLSGTVTGTYTLGGTPTFPATVVTTTGVQTLTNKTLTSPTINSPTLTNASISADSITGYTASTTGSIYGISVTSGIITGAGTIGSAALATNAVQASQMATNAITLGYAQITSNFTTTSTSSVQITGLTTTVTVPSGGRKIKITGYCYGAYNSTTSTNTQFQIWQGTVASGTQLQNATFNSIPSASLTCPFNVVAVVSLSAGSYTFNIGAAVQAGTGTYPATSTSPAFILVEAI